MLSQESHWSIVMSLFFGVLGFVKNKNKELQNETNSVTYVKSFSIEEHIVLALVHRVVISYETVSGKYCYIKD